MTPYLRTDGTDSVYPFWGRVKNSLSLSRFARLFSSIEARMTLYVAVIAAAATLVAGSLVVTGHGLGNPWAVGALCLAAVVAQHGRIELGRNLHASISTFPVVLTAVLFGPLAAMPVALASMLADPFRPSLRWISYASSRSLTAAAAGLVAFRFFEGGSGDLATIVGAACAAALIAQSLDVAFGAAVFKLRGLGNPWSFLGTVSPLLLAAIPLYAPVVALLVFGYGEVSPWVLPLFLAPALAAQRSFVLYQHERRLTEDLVAANERLERANLSFATALVATLDARDRYTAGHSAAVAVYARDIASRMGLSEERQKLAHVCGLVHDIGKIGLPPGLLEKPGALTLEERRLMERHSEIGEGILAKVDDYGEIAKIVRHHHERVDGQGYPDGLAGEDIPLISRIIAVADAYNAMTSDRPYRDAMPSRVARMRLAQAVQSQFDTSVVAAFEAILAGATEEYRSGIRMDFTLEVNDAEHPPLRAVGAA